MLNVTQIIKLIFGLKIRCVKKDDPIRNKLLRILSMFVINKNDLNSLNLNKYAVYYRC
jgi:hypothetical protein